MSKESSSLFWLSILIILGLHYGGIWSIDSLFDPDAKDVEVQLGKYSRNGLTIKEFKKSLGGDFTKTSLQKAATIKNYEDTRVAWTGKVQDVESIRGFYRIKMESDYTPENDLERALSNGIRFVLGSKSYKHIESVCGWIYIYPRNKEESQVLSNLRRGDGFRYEGILKDIDSESCVTVKPALLSRDRSEVIDKGFNSATITKKIDDASNMVKDIKEGIKKGLIEGIDSLDSEKVGTSKSANQQYSRDFKLTNNGKGFHTCTGKVLKDAQLGILICEASPDEAGKILEACSINTTCQVTGRIRGHGVFEWYEVEVARSLQ